MPLEHVVAAPVIEHAAERLPAPDAILTDPALLQPGIEHVRVVDRVFTPSKEEDLIVRMAGLWTGVCILRDLAIENFHTAPEELDPRRKPRREDEPTS
jgi:hypothetical protein